MAECIRPRPRIVRARLEENLVVAVVDSQTQMHLEAHREFLKLQDIERA